MHENVFFIWFLVAVKNRTTAGFVFILYIQNKKIVVQQHRTKKEEISCQCLYLEELFVSLVFFLFSFLSRIHIAVENCTKIYK